MTTQKPTSEPHGAMLDVSSPLRLDVQAVEALAVAHAWGRAFEERDLRGLLALSTPDIRLGDGDRAADGHDGVRRMLLLQSYGVAQHARPVRYLVRGATAVVEATLELRWVDGGELAETRDGVAVFEISDGRVRRFCPRPDLAAAFRTAGWAPTDLP
jgi:SnoaL-like protein